jgi:tetratricopeptide (TPR) repeat protein
VAKFLGDEELQFDMYTKLFSKVNLSNPGDWKVVLRLVVGFVGPNAPNSPLNRDHQRDLLDILISKGAGRSILHHRGLLEQKAGMYERAEEFLKRALDDRQRFDESYRRESDQNILTSLGSLYSAWGIEERRAGNLAQSERLLEEAARCFLEARSGRVENAHAYHAHANMLWRKAQSDKDMPALDYIGEALDILDQAKKVLDDEILLPIRELEAELLAEFGNADLVSQVARELADQHGSSAGYAVWAAAERRRLPLAGHPGLREGVENVIAICQQGLQVDGTDYRILRTLAACYRTLGVGFLKQRYDALLRVKSCAPRFVPDIVYKLGCVAFSLGHFKESKIYFDELRDRAEAQDIRFRGREFVADEKGDRKRFRGTIHECQAYRGDVACPEFREPYFTIYFNPRYLTSSVVRGDRITFHVHFNVFGPYARDIRTLRH